IKERTKIFAKDNKIVFEDDGKEVEVSSDSKVSMNFWCFTPYVFSICKELFDEFLKTNLNQLKSEIYVVDVAASFITLPDNVLKVIPTNAKWFGVTYKEDAPDVENNINALISKGEYPSSLW